MSSTKTVQRACQVLRRRVRFRDASFRLPTEGGIQGSGLGNAKDTEAIREATRLFVESWIVPILDAMELGDQMELRRVLGNSRPEYMDPAVAGICRNLKCDHSGIVEPFNGQRIPHNTNGSHLETCRCSQCSGVS